MFSDLPTPLSTEKGSRLNLRTKAPTESSKTANGRSPIPKALEAETEGSDMTVRCGTKEITLKNILVGDVYMAVGQSNIAIPLTRW